MAFFARTTAKSLYSQFFFHSIVKKRRKKTVENVGVKKCVFMLKKENQRKRRLNKRLKISFCRNVLPIGWIWTFFSTQFFIIWNTRKKKEKCLPFGWILKTDRHLTMSNLLCWRRFGFRKVKSIVTLQQIVTNSLCIEMPCQDSIRWKKTCHSFELILDTYWAKYSTRFILIYIINLMVVIWQMIELITIIFEIEP